MEAHRKSFVLRKSWGRRLGGTDLLRCVERCDYFLNFGSFRSSAESEIEQSQPRVKDLDLKKDIFAGRETGERAARGGPPQKSGQGGNNLQLCLPLVSTSERRTRCWSRSVADGGTAEEDLAGGPLRGCK